MTPSVHADPVGLLHRFYFWLDENRYEDMATLLCPDGVWLRQGQALRGPGALVDALRLRSPTARVRHVLTNGFHEILPDGEASVSLYQTVFKDPHASQGTVSTIEGPSQVAVILARLRRGPDGGWLISHLQSRREFEFTRVAAATP